MVRIHQGAFILEIKRRLSAQKARKALGVTLEALCFAAHGLGVASG